jgi:hypothetical protein
MSLEKFSEDYKENKMPKITFIAPSHRTYLWKIWCSSVITNLDWEAIFVSDIEPQKEEIPYEFSPHFKYIISPVKPAQCFEIAYRYSTGDYIVWCGDDIMFSSYAIDQAYNFHKSFHDHKVMSIFRFFEDGTEATYYHKLPWDDKVQLACTALISKKAIEEVGGLADVTFVTGHWDADLMMRIYANGGRGYINPLACAYEPHIAFHKKEANFALEWAKELEYFTSLWKKDEKTTFERQKSFIPYIDTDILTISQGNKGKWI